MNVPANKNYQETHKSAQLIVQDYFTYFRSHVVTFNTIMSDNGVLLLFVDFSAFKRHIIGVKDAM